MNGERRILGIKERLIMKKENSVAERIEEMKNKLSSRALEVLAAARMNQLVEKDNKKK